MNIPTVTLNPEIDKKAIESADLFLEVSGRLTDKSYWPLKIFIATNLFLWHLDAFAKDEDPVPLFIDIMDRSRKTLEAIGASRVCGDHFPQTPDAGAADDDFEEKVSGLFSDIWVTMTDDIYFDQSFDFTKERFLKNGIDPFDFFQDKTVLDAGCGSGKFSAAIARFGARNVIGIDLGEKGLAFARKQAQKTGYRKRLAYGCGSLLDLPVRDGSVDMVWSNGVVHHTLGYETCIAEFARVLRPGGKLFLYVNGRFGLLELLMDTLRQVTRQVPRALFQHFLTLLNVNSGRLYWMLDFLYAPYEWKSKKEVFGLLKKNGFRNITQLLRGVETDQIELVTRNIPYAEIKYGDAQLKFIAERE